MWGTAMKVYTGGGDKGKTSLFSGERVAKHNLRIESYGDLDELNSIIGLIVSKLDDSQDRLKKELTAIQGTLFQASAWLAVTPDSPAMEYLEALEADVVPELESMIDAVSDMLPPLKVFILPGGNEAASVTHVARTVCRRCERRVSQLVEETDLGSTAEVMHTIQVYLNRLSDYLFVAARYINYQAGVKEQAWQQ